MAEGTYEYECMRAELLGIDKPDYEQFVKDKEMKENERNDVEEAEQDTENLKECEVEGEQMKNVAGGLDEINHILSITQKKIDRFKVRCNSITSLLKMKVGSLSGGETNDNTSSEVKPDEQEREPPEGGDDTDNIDETQSDRNKVGTSTTNQRKTDLTKALDNHVDKLDSMLESADDAYHSMSQQNKQMKKFLK